MNLNKYHLMGRVTRDPELRVLQSGASICSFGMATNRKWKAEDGTEKEEVLFIDVDAWGKQGEVIAKYVAKGKPLYVEGRLRLEQWEDKNTKEKRSRIKVTLESFQFLGTKDDNAGGGSEDSRDHQQSHPPRQEQQRQAPPPRSAQPPTNIDEDVPF